MFFFKARGYSEIHVSPGKNYSEIHVSPGKNYLEIHQDLFSYINILN